ncbi:MAG: glycosyltransferase [Bacteroidota bacterium]
MAVNTSVIIATYNGACKIGSLLNSLLSQLDATTEIIVVVDGSTDDTLEVLKPFEKKISSLKVIAQENQGRARARNRGVQLSTGNLYIFYDDDMTPAINSVARHRSFHESRSGIVSGYSVEPMRDTKTDIQNYKASLTVKWTDKYAEGLTLLSYDNLFFSAANSSCTKQIFEKLNGFDERITDAEDHDLAYRALQNGIHVYFDKGNTAIHDDPITARKYIDRLRAYARAHDKLRSFYPDRYARQVKRGFLKRSLYRLFALSFLPAMIDRETLVGILPKSLRYKFYDIVIQALAVEYPDIKLK